MAWRVLYGAVNVLLFLSIAVALERTARAYVDPGSGLLVLQSVGALVSGALFYFRGKLRRLLFRHKPVPPGAP